MVAIDKHTVCPRLKSLVGTFKHAGGQEPVPSQLQYICVPISKPFNQMWLLSSPLTQILAEEGVHWAQVLPGSEKLRKIIKKTGKQ